MLTATVSLAQPDQGGRDHHSAISDIVFFAGGSYMAWMYILQCSDWTYYVGSSKSLTKEYANTNKDWEPPIHPVDFP